MNILNIFTAVFFPFLIGGKALFLTRKARFIAVFLEMLCSRL